MSDTSIFRTSFSESIWNSDGGGAFVEREQAGLPEPGGKISLGKSQFQLSECRLPNFLVIHTFYVNDKRFIVHLSTGPSKPFQLWKMLIRCV